MNNNPTPYPLAWPTGWPRTRAGDRERSRFRNARAVDDQLSMTDATSRLIRECRLLGAANVIQLSDVATSSRTSGEVRAVGVGRSSATAASADRREPDAAEPHSFLRPLRNFRPIGMIRIDG